MSRPLLLLLLAGSVGCATTQAVRLDQGQVQDRLEVLEVETLEDARKFHELLEASGAIYEDQQLQVYLDQLSRPLVPQLPPSSPYRFRFRLVSDPTLNAFTLGDGTIYLNTGLIARLRTAQQLAFVLGHEIGHVVHRDMVYFTDDFHRKTVGVKLSDLILTPALSIVGLGGVGELGMTLAYAASVTGYGREREAQADHESLELMRRMGFDEREAIRVFETFLAEQDRYQKGIEIGFLSSHPANERRLEAVKAFMGSKAIDVFTPEPIDKTFLDLTQELRIDNAAFNIKLGRYYHAVEDLQIILRRTPDSARARYHLAEAYRLIAEEPKKLQKELSRKAWRDLKGVGDKEQREYWQERAAEEYQRAMTADTQFPDPHRGLGLLRYAEDLPGQALASLQHYLELAPTAKDRRFVETLMSRIRTHSQQPVED